MQLDTYDERVMFSDAFPLLAAYPTSAALTRFPQIKTRFKECKVRKAVRRVSIYEPWSEDNVVFVRIPAELVDAHAAEVSAFRVPAPAKRINSRQSAPVDEYRIASLAVMRRETVFDAARWARGVLRGDEQGMLSIIEQKRDWCAWAPMIRLAQRARESDVLMDRAENRLRLIARRLLDASGFAKVRVDDTLAHQPALQRALCTTLRG
jgi:hypothetical protein